jgi:hypothetical protein
VRYDGADLVARSPEGKAGLFGAGKHGTHSSGQLVVRGSQDFLEFLSTTLVGMKRRADIDFSRSSRSSEAVAIDIFASLDATGFGS